MTSATAKAGAQSSMPSFPVIERTLREAEVFSRPHIPWDQIDRYVKLVGGHVLRAWYPAPSVDPTAGDVDRTFKTLRHMLRIALEQLASFDEADPAIQQLIAAQRDVDLGEYRAALAYHADELGYLLAVTAKGKRAVGRPSLKPNDGNAPPWRPFVYDVLADIRKCGGNLSTNRNNNDEGSLPRFLEKIRPLLPAGFLPKIMSARTLDHIAAVDRNSKRAV
jgi:hypothetical protein